ncbi:MAG: L-2-amino-thiazoline-4-carboxylic acid hydrolase [Candidatus Hodarchaeales archaeon]|jgi:hypothetical protein
MEKKATTTKEHQKQKIWEKVKEIRDNWNNPSELGTLLNKWDRDFGSEFNEIASELVGKNAQKLWAVVAEEEKRNSIDDLIDILWEGLKDAGGEYTVERTDKGSQIYCTKCPIADSYLKIGQEKYGLLFHCVTDPYICAGFNPKINYRRTKTLMEGDDCCDHFYSMKKIH